MNVSGNRGGERDPSVEEWVAHLEWGKVPSLQQQLAGLLSLDSIACCLLSSRTELALPLRAGAAAMDAGGKTVVPGIKRTYGKMAGSFLLGGLVHAQNFDALGPYMSHVSVGSFPAAWASVGSAGRILVSDYLTAVVISAELVSRVAFATHEAREKEVDFRWLDGQVVSYMSGALAAAHLHGLDEAQVRSVLTNALMQAAGTSNVMAGGEVDAKSIYGAYPAASSVLSVQLALAGLESDKNVFGGRGSLFDNFYDLGTDIPPGITDGLERKWYFDRLDIKKWPSSGMLTEFMTAAERIYAETGPARVKRLHMSVRHDLRPWIEPRDERLLPESSGAAANSLQYCVLSVLRHGTYTTALYERWPDLAIHDGSPVEVDITYVPSQDESLSVELADGRQTTVLLSTLDRVHDAAGTVRHKLAAALGEGNAYLIDRLYQIHENPTVTQMAELHALTSEISCL